MADFPAIIRPLRERITRVSMRNILTTFVGVLLALLVFVGIRYLVRRDLQEQQSSEQRSGEYADLQRREHSARESLATADARLSPLNNDDNLLWPPVMEHHSEWKVVALKKACGKPVKIAIYTDDKMNTGGLDYKDANGNLVHFEIDVLGVTVSYADPKHVTNPDLVGSINSIPCLAGVK